MTQTGEFHMNRSVAYVFMAVAAGLLAFSCTSARAKPSVTERCKKGDATSCVLAGRMYRDGQTGQPNFQKALTFFDRGCSLGNIRGCYGAATLASDVSGLNSPETARAYYGRVLRLARPRCKGGDDRACEFLGYLYHTGRAGLPRDHARANRLLDRACTAGSASACWTLWSYLATGLGGTKDMAKAAAYLNRAITLLISECSAGKMASCYDLAMLRYYRGPRPRGRRHWQNTNPQAVPFLEKACNGGYFPACRPLGSIYEKGLSASGVHQYEKAARAYRLGCRGGDFGACLRLGLLYENGRGVPKDRRKALSLYDRACHKGSVKQACSAAELLRAIMK